MKKYAADSMTTRLITIPIDQPIEGAFRLMEERSIRHLPVVDKEGIVVGILSAGDLSRALNPMRPGFAHGLEVADLMSWPPVAVEEKTPLKEVAAAMLAEKVSAFLVKDSGGDIAGIITSDDLLELLQSLLPEETEGGLNLSTLPYTPVVREMMRELSSAGI